MQSRLVFLAALAMSACVSPQGKCRDLCHHAGGANASCSHCDDEACARAIVAHLDDVPSSVLGFDTQDLVYVTSYTEATTAGTCR